MHIIYYSALSVIIVTQCVSQSLLKLIHSFIMGNLIIKLIRMHVICTNDTSCSSIAVEILWMHSMLFYLFSHVTINNELIKVNQTLHESVMHPLYV